MSVVTGVKIRKRKPQKQSAPAPKKKKAFVNHKKYLSFKFDDFKRRFFMGRFSSKKLEGDHVYEMVWDQR